MPNMVPNMMPNIMQPLPHFPGHNLQEAVTILRSRPGRDGLAAGLVPSARCGTHPALPSREVSGGIGLTKAWGATADGRCHSMALWHAGFLCTIASGKDEAWNQSRWPN